MVLKKSTKYTKIIWWDISTKLYWTDSIWKFTLPYLDNGLFFLKPLKVIKFMDWFLQNFPALIIYLFSISYRSGEGYCVPFNFPCVGLSLSFPIIEAQKGLGADELKKYFKESKESVSLNAVAQYHQLDLWDENEEDYYG